MTSRIQRIRLAPMQRAAASVACMLAAACGSDFSSAPTDDAAARAATVFTQLADSIVRAGGDSGMAGAYASLGETLRRGGRLSPVTIAVDGVSAAYVGTAQVNEIGPLCPMCKLGTSDFALRYFIAWQANDPRRVVQVSSASNSDPIRSHTNSTFVADTGGSASLVFFDGKGGLFFGTSGSQHFSITTSDSACTGTGPSVSNTLVYPPVMRCTNAAFAIDFNGTAEPSSFLTGRNNATGSHTFAMGSQAVAGVRLEATDSALVPPPIVTPTRAPLSSTLGVTIDSIVTLTLTVTNPSDSVAKVQFGSGLHADFAIYDASTGARVWQWSVGKLFTQVVSVDTVPAKGQRVFTQQWSPVVKWNYNAVGTLVSQSHDAVAKASFTVP